MSLFEYFVAEGNETTDGLTKDGAILVGGEMARSTKKRGGSYGLAVRSSLSLFGGGVARL